MKKIIVVLSIILGILLIKGDAYEENGYNNRPMVEVIIKDYYQRSQKEELFKASKVGRDLENASSNRAIINEARGYGVYIEKDKLAEEEIKELVDLLGISTEDLMQDGTYTLAGDGFVLQQGEYGYGEIYLLILDELIHPTYSVLQEMLEAYYITSIVTGGQKELITIENAAGAVIGDGNYSNRYHPSNQDNPLAVRIELIGDEQVEWVRVIIRGDADAPFTEVDTKALLVIGEFIGLEKEQNELFIDAIAEDVENYTKNTTRQIGEWQYTASHLKTIGYSNWDDDKVIEINLRITE